jgi:Fe-S-cluster containining protein
MIHELQKKELEAEQHGFSCRRCGKCCMMKLVVNTYDIRKIEQIGKKDFYETDVLGRTVVKMSNNKCIFLKESPEGFVCEVYSARPKGCSDYPFFGNMIMECTGVKR